jgi:hypothetical protein
MNETELGKQRSEQFITEVAKKLDLDSDQFVVLWWSPELPELQGTNEKTGKEEATMPLRIYKGNSWRLKNFSKSDIDNCVKSPEVLAKYEDEITQILTDL